MFKHTNLKLLNQVFGLSSADKIKKFKIYNQHCITMATQTYPTKEEVQNAVRKINRSETEKFVLTETCLRISNPIKTVEFYTGVLGMTLLLHRDDEKTRSSYYVFTFVDEALIPRDDERAFHKWRLGRSGNLELTYSWDGITSPTKYKCGNLDPEAFGHFGICVPDYAAALKRVKDLGCEILENEADPSLSYILDPDGYRVELFECHWS